MTKLGYKTNNDKVMMKSAVILLMLSDHYVSFEYISVDDL